MDLVESLRSTGAVREFTGAEVPDEVVYRLLDTARFAPSGGNRQAWHVVWVRDPASTRALRDIYLRGWYPYLAMASAGLTPWAPIGDRHAEGRALEQAADFAASAAAGTGGFAEHLDTVPVLLVVLADLRRLAAADRDLDRYTLVGGASVYPFVWSVLLAARSEGLGGVMTTMAVRHEDEVRSLVGAPEEYAVAAVVALGHPVHRSTRLSRRRVEEFATVDRFDGPPLASGSSAPDRSAQD